jgi:hypothetical protein
LQTNYLLWWRLIKFTILLEFYSIDGINFLMIDFLQLYKILYIEVNGFFHRIDSIVKLLPKYTYPLAAMRKNKEFPGNIGSCALIKYKEKYYLICTRHQLVEGNKFNYNYKNLGILFGDKVEFISSGGIAYYPKGNESDALDIVVLNYTESCKERRELKELFFDFREMPPLVPSTQVVSFIVSGYPQAETEYEGFKKIKFIMRSIECTLANQEEQGYDEALMVLKPSKPVTNYNGLSGGAAFVIITEGEKAKAYFAGIVARAGENDVRIIKSGFIINHIDNFIAKRNIKDSTNADFLLPSC